MQAANIPDSLLTDLGMLSMTTFIKQLNNALWLNKYQNASTISFAKILIR